MKYLASAAFSAATLAAAFIGSAAPVEARGSVGVYVGGPGYYGYDDRYRGYGYCDDYWYRRSHPRRCGYAYDYDDYDYPGYYDGYYPGVGFEFFGGGGRHHHFHHFDHRGHDWGGRNWGHNWGGHRHR